MLFDLANCSLIQKMALLVVGTTLFVSLAIGAISDLMLRHLAADLVQSKLSDRVVAYDLRTGTGVGQAPRKTESPLVLADAEAVSQVQSQAGAGIGDRTAGPGETSEDWAELGSMRRTLLLLSLLVFAAVTSIGIYVACSVLEPLRELERDADRLAKGDTSIKLRGLHRSDEIGHIAQSLAGVQQSLIEWSLLKAQRASVVSHPSGAVAAAAREIWAAVSNELRNIKVLLLSEYHVVAANFRGPEGGSLFGRTASPAWDVWKAWLTGDTRIYRSATGK
jgi:HAMP domain-containing protein